MENTLKGATGNGYVSKTKRTIWIRRIKKLFETEVEQKMALVHQLRSELRQASDKNQHKKLRDDLAGAIRDIRVISFRFTKLPGNPKLSDLYALYEASNNTNNTEKPSVDFVIKFTTEFKGIAQDIKRLRYGIRQQTADFHSGVYDLVIAAADGDKTAFQTLQEELNGFIEKIASHYQGRIKYESRFEIRAYILDEMFKAIRDWRKNKHFGYKQWIVGKVRRALKDIRIEIYKKEAKERTYPLADLEQMEGQEQVITKFDLNEKEKRIWIWEAAILVGVCAQTLRNWDASGKFPCKWQEKNGKKYRYYTQEDIGELYKLKIREIYMDKYRIKTVAYVFKTSVKTLKRLEASGRIPKAKQDNEGRYYTVKDVKNIRKVTKMKIAESKLSKREEFIRLVEPYRRILSEVSIACK